MQLRLFKPIKISDNKSSKTNQRGAFLDSEEAVSLEEIMTAQVDEPHQRSCIYSTQVVAQAKNQEPTTKYLQIRVKSIKFLEKEAVAVYFYDMTHHIES